MKNKVCFDIGTWSGDSIIEFNKRRNQNKDYKIYGFEPHPDLKNHLEELSKEEDFDFLNGCAWIKYGLIDFYPGVNNLTQLSTIFKDKKKFIDRNISIKVKSINFPNFFLIKNIDMKYCIIKMNCEGCEYDILENMIKNSSIKKVNELYVAWHVNKINSISKERHVDLVKQLKRIDGLILKTWKYEEGQKESPFIEI